MNSNHGAPSMPFKRVFLWAVPRSISTAFFRAMMNNKDVKVLLEPYSKAYYYGEERLSTRYKDHPIEANCKFSDMRDICEAPYQGCGAVFVKDMAYYLKGRMEASLPRGYTHTFLIRNPAKTIRSLYKMSTDNSLTGWTYFDSAEIGYKELHELFQHVKETTGETPLVIDADDLLAKPRETLQAYCIRTGILYDEVMVNWDSTPPDMSVFQEWLPWFEGMLNSKAFNTPTKSKPAIGYPELPDYAQKCIDENMAYYNTMFEARVVI